MNDRETAITICLAASKESEDGEGVESTAAIGRLIKAGMKEVNYLDAIVRNKYTRNADKLGVWDSASHIEHAPQRERKRVPPASVITPPKPNP